MHKLLRRQIKRHLQTTPALEELTNFFNAVEQAYLQADQDRNLIERSLHLTSEELNERNNLLREQISELEDIHTRLEQSHSVLNAIFDATGEAIMSFDVAGHLVKCNQMALSLLSIDSVQKYQKMTYRSIVKIYRLLKDPTGFIHDLKKLENEPIREMFGFVSLKDGQVFEYHSSPQVRDNKLLGRVWCFRNITELKKNEALVQYQAQHDNLTKLPNRTLLKDRLEHALAFATGTGKSVAILYIDLDHFKKVNDTSGHQAGDQLLIEVAKRTQSCLREQDTLSRLGGDEFVVLLENINNHSLTTNICKRIMHALKEPFSLGNMQYFISCSIGISIYPKDGNNPEILLRKADMGMYHAKKLGRSNFQYFDPTLEKEALHYLSVENQLRQALLRDELEVYYQPQINLHDQSFDSTEALIRWKGPDGKMIPPIEFIPIAEQTGLISNISNWVLHKTCKQIITWQKMGLNPIKVSVNLSPKELLEHDLAARIQHILKQYNVPGHMIELEITETMFLEDITLVQDLLFQLRALDISIAIDDFGTGYSSMRYLQQLPIDTLKIDKTFILHLLENPQDAAIANSIISLGHNLRLNVIAEGVEDLATAEYLKEKGCHQAQGFYYHRPMDAASITELLLLGNKKTAS